MGPAQTVDGYRARNIAEEFLGQKYENSMAERPVLKGDLWHVEAIVTDPPARIEVLVNSRTGFVEGFTKRPHADRNRMPMMQKDQS